jgi:hypothetical protein
MNFIYYDESGQIGGDITKQSISNNFYCALIISDKPKDIERSIKKTVQGFSPNQIKKFSGTLHAYRELDKTRLRLLNYLARTDIKIAVLKVDKQKLHSKFPKQDDTALYQYTVAQFIGKAVKGGIIELEDTIVLSRYFVTKTQNNRLIEMVSVETNTENCRVEPASQNPCLQAVDFIAWAYYMKHERNRSDFFDVISHKVIADYSV